MMDGKRLSQRIFRLCLFPESAHAKKYVGNQVNPRSSFLRNINHVIPGRNITGVVRSQSAKTVFSEFIAAILFRDTSYITKLKTSFLN